MSDSTYLNNALLRSKLSNLMSAGSSVRAPGHLGPLTVVVTANEVNDRHGTGPLVRRVLAGRKPVLSIRSRDHWGMHEFGESHFMLSHQGLTRRQSFERVIAAVGGRQIQSVLCVPYLIDELLTAIALHDVFDAPLCAYVMDDQNVATKGIPDDLMREFLDKCEIRFATHPELCEAYRKKFGHPFYILPAVVPDQLVARTQVDYAPPASGMRFALLGSIWDQVWFDRLCDAMGRVGVKVDWFGNNKSPWLKFPAQQLREAGIVPRGVVPEDQLVEELRSYPFVIVPMSMLDKTDSNRGVAALSLPGRILFAAAGSHTPALILGSPQTCGARFVSHFEIGETASYRAADIAIAIEKLTDPARQAKYRRNAARVGPLFSDAGVSDWLAQSIKQGKPADTRFETAFAGYVERIGELKTIE